jgi:hypothetical protein
MLKIIFTPLFLAVPGFALAMPDPVSDPLSFKQSLKDMSIQCQSLVEKTDRDLCVSQMLKRHRESMAAAQKKGINKHFSGVVEQERMRRAKEY